MFNKDNIKLGLVLGFVAPVLGMFGYYFWKFNLFTFNEFLQVLMIQKSLLSGIISIALIANALLFTVYVNRQKDKTARGIFFATCLYALVTLGFKWFG